MKQTKSNGHKRLLSRRSRPILIITYPANTEQATIAIMINNLRFALGDEYHVLLFEGNQEGFTYDCFNHELDNKSLLELKDFVNQIAK